MIGSEAFATVCDNAAAMATEADKLRASLEDLGLSQREAARVLEVQEGIFRGWCMGKAKVPNVVWLALEALTLRRANEDSRDQLS